LQGLSQRGHECPHPCGATAQDLAVLHRVMSMSTQLDSLSSEEGTNKNL
jgi:hypothetical protein